VNIEILGVGFANKGAELMLHAVVQELTRACPTAKLAVRPQVGPYEKRARIGLFQKPGISEAPFWGFLLVRIWRRKLRQRYGIVLDSEVDAVLDASGFAYTDQWGPGPAERLARKAKRWKRAGKKLVLLPQAFGPFTQARTARAFRTIVENADLLFARDQESYNHAVGVGGERKKLKIAPDFTNLVEGKVPTHFLATKKRACLIPNSNMLEKTSGSTSGSYVPFLAACAEILDELGVEPFLLVHSTRKDLDLAEAVRTSLGRPLEVLQEEDPLAIKGIIGSCHLVVGSRFHGLVSALSQGIPSLGAGWSHKYNRLFEDYGCPDLLLSNLDRREEAVSCLKRLADGDGRKALVDTLREASAEQARRSRRMWGEVLGVLGAVSPSRTPG